MHSSGVHFTVYSGKAECILRRVYSVVRVYFTPVSTVLHECIFAVSSLSNDFPPCLQWVYFTFVSFFCRFSVCNTLSSILFRCIYALYLVLFERIVRLYRQCRIIVWFECISHRAFNAVWLCFMPCLQCYLSVFYVQVFSVVWMYLTPSFVSVWCTSMCSLSF